MFCKRVQVIFGGGFHFAVVFHRIVHNCPVGGIELLLLPSTLTHTQVNILYS